MGNRWAGWNEKTGKGAGISCIARRCWDGIQKEKGLRWVDSRTRIDLGVDCFLQRNILNT